MISLPPATLNTASDLTTKEKGRRAAGRLGDSLGSRLLRRSREPLDLHAVASLEGIKVIQASTLDESGRIEWTNRGLRVALRATDGRRRQRFTLAHELGHHLIFGIEEGQERTYSPEEETRCDKFAASLLMPKPTFWSALTNLRSLSRASAACDLADRFDVSLSSVMRRLKDLGAVERASILLLIELEKGNAGRVSAGAYDSSVYRPLERLTTQDLWIEQKLAHAMSMRPGSRRVPVSARLPTKGRGLPPGSHAILPAVMTCIPLRGRLDHDRQRVLVDIDPVVDPLRPQFRKSPSELQADLIPEPRREPSTSHRAGRPASDVAAV